MLLPRRSLLLLSLLCACEWTPTARPAEPRQVASGSFDLITTIKVNGAVLAVAAEPDGRLVLVNVDEGSLCRVTVEGVLGAIVTGPPGESDPTSVQGIRLAIREPGDRRLHFVDEACEQVGPSQATELDPSAVSGQDGAARARFLALDPELTLWLLDPWEETRVRLADNVASYSDAPRQGPDEPLRVWTNQDGALVLVDEEGREEARLGTDVSEGTQTLAAGARIAFVDGGSLYEAVSPRYEPAWVRDDACQPVYRGAKLTFFHPCEAEQFTRVDFTTGVFEEYDPGVFFAWGVAGWEFERARVVEGDEVITELYATPPNGERQRVRPNLVNITPLSNSQLVGMDGDRNFGLWTTNLPYVAVLQAVTGMVPLIDARRDGLLWLAHHQAGEDGRGVLSLLDEGSFSITNVADNVLAGQYALLLLAQEQAAVAALHSPDDVGAVLEVRLVPDLLGDILDEGVVDFDMLPDPRVPEALYVVATPGREGLWRTPL